MAKNNELRERIAQEFVKALNENQLPWHSMWLSQRAYNATTEKDYHGLNALWLAYQAGEKGYTDPRWCTFKQATDNGWHVRKGEKGTQVEFWSVYNTKTRATLTLEEADEVVRKFPDRKDDMRMLSKSFTVFNAEQIDGIPQLEKQAEIDISTLRAQRDTLLQNMGLAFREGGDQAYYRPSDDSLTMPPDTAFQDDYSYMSVFLHECGHATGHESRFNRDLSGRFGSESYAKEELRAEIASAFTSQALGFKASEAQKNAALENHKAYIQSWAKAITDAPNELFAAIKDAEKISDYLIEKGEFERVQKAKEAINPDIEKRVIDALEKEFVPDEQRSLYESLLERINKDNPQLTLIEKTCVAASILPDEDIITVDRAEMAKELYELYAIDEQRDYSHLAKYFDCEAIIKEAREEHEGEQRNADFYSDEEDEEYPQSFEKYMEEKYGINEYSGTDEQRAIALLNTGLVSAENYFDKDKYLMAFVKEEEYFGPQLLLNRQTNEVFSVPNISYEWAYKYLERAYELQNTFEREYQALAMQKFETEDREEDTVDALIKRAKQKSEKQNQHRENESPEEKRIKDELENLKRRERIMREDLKKAENVLRAVKSGVTAENEAFKLNIQALEKRYGIRVDESFPKKLSTRIQEIGAKIDDISSYAKRTYRFVERATDNSRNDYAM